ncbi:arsenic resistance N-acetyltransferase ArsN2 [Tengunoibacter tsumagoiensis]|uniref:N-acetyltransferase domain-containing protein n=1 Tax=Tengunoibacter tsumagoiensis TaxID=2014871 RepID=A0A402A8M8_9CHLR|nr:arsenic resistance N-acetyltransferase ArsN2 [Tengunoibacter tsumagoiensis]GCE15448.1 hypothetical protein KTT_53070 [Tengunoibacter tsumagoiensis]
MSLIARAQPEDVQAVLTLLTRCGLPQAGLSNALESLLIAREGHQIVGCAALELYGSVALLRSVAVDPLSRSSGLGHQMVEAQLAYARTHGIGQIYLLTETAIEYFPRFGFQLIERSAVAPAIRTSVEWEVACPQSAHVMVVQLGTGHV